MGHEPALTNNPTLDKIWQFTEPDEIQFSDQCLTSAVQCWPVSRDSFNMVTILLSIVTSLCGQAEIVQQVVRKESAIQSD